MKNNQKDTPANRKNWQESFTHQKSPKRVAPRMASKGTRGMRKGAR